MRWTELCEARMAPLYHIMSYEKAENVFMNNAMPARWEHDIPGYGKVKGNSFTRNKNPRIFWGRPVRLTMNQQAMASRHKIIPLDGEIVFANGRGMRSKPDRAMNAPQSNQFAEEFVIGDIAPLHKMISLIELRESNFYLLSGRNAVALMEITQHYCEKYSIPLNVDPKFAEQIDEIKRMWAEDDD